MNNDQELIMRLNVLRDQPARDPIKSERGREAFLAMAEQMAVAMPEARRRGREHSHHRWTGSIQNAFHYFTRMDLSPLFRRVAVAVLIVCLMVVGSGITISFAQSSMPDDPLYRVKLWSEDVRYTWVNNDQARYQLMLFYVNRRSEEINRMLSAGKTLPEAVWVRMQSEMELAIRLAGNQPDDVPGAMTTICEQIEAQLSVMQRLASPGNEEAKAVRDRIQKKYEEDLRLCEASEENLELLPEKEPAPFKTGDPTSPDHRQLTGTPTHGSGHQPGAGEGSGNHDPWITGTPTPGSGSGFGPGDDKGTPTSSINNGPGEGNNPWGNGSPTPPAGTEPGPGGGNGPGSGGGYGDDSPNDPVTATPGSDSSPGEGSGGTGGRK